MANGELDVCEGVEVLGLQGRHWRLPPRLPLTMAGLGKQDGFTLHYRVRIQIPTSLRNVMAADNWVPEQDLEAVCNVADKSARARQLCWATAPWTAASIPSSRTARSRATARRSSWNRRRRPLGPLRGLAAGPGGPLSRAARTSRSSAQTETESPPTGLQSL